MFKSTNKKSNLPRNRHLHSQHCVFKMSKNGICFFLMDYQYFTSHTLCAQKSSIFPTLTLAHAHMDGARGALANSLTRIHVHMHSQIHSMTHCYGNNAPNRLSNKFVVAINVLYIIYLFKTGHRMHVACDAHISNCFFFLYPIEK